MSGNKDAAKSAQNAEKSALEAGTALGRVHGGLGREELLPKGVASGDRLLDLLDLPLEHLEHPGPPGSFGLAIKRAARESQYSGPGGLSSSMRLGVGTGTALRENVHLSDISFPRTNR